jgi:sporulation protein YlmC with PRC-barrel domain
MLIELTKLENMPVGAMDEGAAIGKVRRTLVSPEEEKLLGITVKTAGFFGKVLVVSIQDVVDIDRGGVVVRSREALVAPDEIVRIKEIFKKKFSLIGLRVKDNSGKTLGRVSDAVVETTTGAICRLYVKSLLNELVYEHSQIEKITWTEVVVKSEREARAKVKEDLSAQKIPEIA